MMSLLIALIISCGSNSTNPTTKEYDFFVAGKYQAIYSNDILYYQKVKYQNGETFKDQRGELMKLPVANNKYEEVYFVNDGKNYIIYTKDGIIYDYISSAVKVMDDVIAYRIAGIDYDIYVHKVNGIIKIQSIPSYDQITILERV